MRSRAANVGKFLEKNPALLEIGKQWTQQTYVHAFMPLYMRWNFSRTSTCVENYTTLEFHLCGDSSVLHSYCTRFLRQKCAQMSACTYTTIEISPKLNAGKSQTIGDFTFFRPSQILPIYRQRSVPDFPCYELFICDKGTGAQQFRGLVMSEIHRRRMPMSRTVQIWVFICREWSPTITEI